MFTSDLQWTKQLLTGTQLGKTQRHLSCQHVHLDTPLERLDWRKRRGAKERYRVNILVRKHQILLEVRSETGNAQNFTLTVTVLIHLPAVEELQYVLKM